MYCTKCGKLIPDESSYCLYCGAEVEKKNNQRNNISLDNEPINKKHCVFCGKEILKRQKINDLNQNGARWNYSGNFTHSKPIPVDFQTYDGRYICNICANQKKLGYDFIAHNSLEKICNYLTSEGIASLDTFTPNKRIQRIIVKFERYEEVLDAFLEFDEKRQLLNVPQFCGNQRKDFIFAADKLVDFEMLENESSILSGNSILGAVVGETLAGDVGGIVGAGIRGHKLKGKCESLSIKLVLNDLKNPTVYINFISTSLKKDSETYQKLYSAAQECISVLTIILKQVQTVKSHEENDAKPSLNNTPADEIKKYKELLDIGAITEDEFRVVKAKLLNF